MEIDPDVGLAGVDAGHGVRDANHFENQLIFGIFLDDGKSGVEKRRGSADPVETDVVDRRAVAWAVAVMRPLRDEREEIQVRLLGDGGDRHVFAGDGGDGGAVILHLSICVKV